MLILTIRTDKPEAEIGLFDNETQLAYVSWLAHRRLAETLHTQIRELLSSQAKNLHDIQGIVCYQGPGSFTGLRIGLTVGNALAYALQAAIVAENGEAWRENGVKRLQTGDSDTVVVPEYGAAVHITLPKK